MKTTLVLWLLLMGALNLFLPGEVFVVLMVVLIIIFSSVHKAIIYTSSFSILMPLIVLVFLGILRGLDHTNKDFYRDIYIFSKNIIYFLGGVALSRYILNLNHFFVCFLILAFASSLLHFGLILIHLHSISSLETIRYFAGYGNAVEGILLSLFLSFMLSKSFRSVINALTIKHKLMVITIIISFLLYFSRTLIVLVIVASFFLTDNLYIRKIFSRKNVKIFNLFALVLGFFFLISLIASLQPSNSPLGRLVDKFKNIPDEVSWNAKKNRDAAKQEIQENWRGYEAYQGLLKFNKGDDLQKSLGFGFGERVDLGIIMKLAGVDYENVPILHNEYVGLLIKCGIAGLLLYLLFLYKIGFGTIRYSKNDYPELYYSYQMLSAFSIITLLNTYIGFGLLNQTNTAVPIVMGFLWGNIQKHILSIKTQSYPIDE